jgi:hypothetical protein
LQIEDIDRDARAVVVRDRKDPNRKAGNNQTVPLLPKVWQIAAQLSEGRKVGGLFAISAGSASTAFTRTFTALAIEPCTSTAEFFRIGLDIPQVAPPIGHKRWTAALKQSKVATVSAWFADHSSERCGARVLERLRTIDEREQ